MRACKLGVGHAVPVGPAAHVGRRAVLQHLALGTHPGAKRFSSAGCSGRQQTVAASAVARPQAGSGGGTAGAGRNAPGTGGGDGSGAGPWEPQQAVPAEASAPAQLQDVVLLDVAGAPLRLRASASLLPSRPPQLSRVV